MTPDDLSCKKGMELKFFLGAWFVLCLVLGCGDVVLFGGRIGTVCVLCVVLSFKLLTVTSLNWPDANIETKLRYPSPK